MSPSRSIRDELTDLQAACRACRRCVDDGIIPAASPTFAGRWDAPFFLVGQAPGPVEVQRGRPFAGRAGRELARWMARAGFESEEEFRRLTYIAALMRCFPGRNPSGTGDRPPPVRAVRSCASWLDAELALLRPRVLIAVGQLAIRRFLGPGGLEERVGRTFGDAPLVVPLPHPSGQSRWLNEPANRERLAAALAILGEQRLRVLQEARGGEDGTTRAPPRDGPGRARRAAARREPRDQAADLRERM
jgi:uracil-DNA glycosylase